MFSLRMGNLQISGGAKKSQPIWKEEISIKIHIYKEMLVPKAKHKIGST